jgi:Icc-related predicted phosphoesterase
MADKKNRCLPLDILIFLPRVMKLLVISDIDDLHWRNGAGQVDLVLSLGDVADQVILEAAEAFQTPAIFAVKGNHDANTTFPASIVDLHMTIREYKGITFGGLNGSWRYKINGHFLYDQSEVVKFLSFFPMVDVFISHNSPHGIHDRDDGIHAGFEGLTAYVRRASPKVVVHGHQHVACETKVGKTNVVGVYGFKLMEI